MASCSKIKLFRGGNSKALVYKTDIIQQLLYGHTDIQGLKRMNPFAVALQWD